MNDFPNINDGDELVFFQNNFTKNEIKHALSKHNPKVELACLFSIKESLIKANNKLLNVNFNRINLLSEQGKISYKDSIISTSIEGTLCISVVIIN